MTSEATEPSRALRSGLPGDPADFTALVEIDMIAHLAKTAFSRVLPDDITYAQFGVLNRLVRLDGPESVGQLAKAFMVAQPTMSSTVAKLEKAGWVTRDTDGADARRRPVRITQSGRNKRDEGVRQLDRLRSTMGPALDAAALQAMLPQLRQLREAMESLVLT